MLLQHLVITVNSFSSLLKLLKQDTTTAKHHFHLISTLKTHTLTAASQNEKQNKQSNKQTKKSCPAITIEAKVAWRNATTSCQTCVSPCSSAEDRHHLKPRHEIVHWDGGLKKHRWEIIIQTVAKKHLNSFLPAMCVTWRQRPCWDDHRTDNRKKIKYCMKSPNGLLQAFGVLRQLFLFFFNFFKGC